MFRNLGWNKVKCCKCKEDKQSSNTLVKPLTTTSNLKPGTDILEVMVTGLKRKQKGKGYSILGDSDILQMP